jgi:hypothetical protein
MAEPFRPISHAAVNVLARLAARKEVIEQLRGEGRRVSMIKVATISAMASEHLAKHPELFVEAHAKAQQWGMYEPKRRSRTCSPNR